MDRIPIAHINREITLAEFDDTIWAKAGNVDVNSYWSGDKAPESRRFTARLLWSDTSLYVRFDAEQHEPLVVSGEPVLTEKVYGLWERDVCEIFIAPDASMPNRYYEFEISPSGEWLDLGIELTPKGGVTNWEYTSGMETAVKIDRDNVIEVVRIPFGALGGKPEAGDVWLGNLFRCVGRGETRGYLAWRPTKTAKPSFHVPSAFGEFEFLG
jgi:hypothetical protein